MMPRKLVVVTLEPWQVAQPVVMPWWLNCEPLKCLPVVTGNCKLLLAPTWHTSHPVLPNGMWLFPGPVMVKPAEGIA